MKTISFIKKATTALIVAAVVFAGCEEDPVKVTGISLSKTMLTLTEGGSETLVATITPADAENKAITWAVTAGDAATVDAGGKVTAVKAGEAIITVTTEDGGFTAECTVTVQVATVTGVTLNKPALNIAIGDSETLVATVVSGNTADKSVEWTSSNPDVATVVSGTVTAVAPGEAVITVTTADGGKTASCTVTVSEPAPMTMTLTTAMEGAMGIRLAGTGTAVIDWDDGSTPETVTLSAYDGSFTDSYRYIHTFSGTTSRTIAIIGQNITHLDCGFLQLTELDVTNNTALTDLNCNNNQLADLDVTKNTTLTFLSCSVNQLTSLDVTKNTALTDLSCNTNQLTELDVTKNTVLEFLGCARNQLTSLDVTKNTALALLYCRDNQLTSLDVTKNTVLEWLHCASNQLTSLVANNNTTLTRLVCFNNRLTSLDMIGNTALAYLWCSANQLSADGLNALFGTLHSNEGAKTININLNPGIGGCDRTIAEGKGWRVSMD